MSEYMTCLDIKKYINRQLRAFKFESIDNNEEYLKCLCELLEFIEENKRQPTTSDFKFKYGYLPNYVYYRHFGGVSKCYALLKTISTKTGKKIKGAKYCNKCGNIINYGSSFSICYNCLEKELVDNSEMKKGARNKINVKEDKQINNFLKELLGDFYFERIENVKSYCIKNEKYDTLVCKTSKLSTKNKWTFNFSQFEDYELNNLNAICFGFDNKNINMLSVFIVPIIKDGKFSKSFVFYNNNSCIKNNEMYLIHSKQ